MMQGDESIKEFSFILPPELQSQIASHCSPRELAALARVHPSYRAEFEKALYEIVILRVSEALYDSNKVSSVALKAEFVKRLLIIIVPSNSSRFMDTLFKTCDLLSQTSNVIDLRVRIPSKPDANIIDTVTDILDKALRQCSLRLETLFYDAYFDLPILVDLHQYSLRCYGLFADGRYESILHHIKKFYDTVVSSKRIAWLLDCDSWHGLYNIISLFPAFHAPGDTPILTALDEEVIPVIDRFGLPSSLFQLSSLASIILLYQNVVQMSELLSADGAIGSHCTFPGVVDLCIQFYTENESKFYPDLTPLLTYLPSLQEIWMRVVSAVFSPVSNGTMKTPPMSRLFGGAELADNCRRICPQLTTIHLGDQSPPIAMGWQDEKGWTQEATS